MPSFKIIVGCESTGAWVAYTVANLFSFGLTPFGGDVPLEEVLMIVDNIIADLVQGKSVLISCKNGAHRSAILLVLVLMRLTGADSEALMNYVCAVRNIADFNSFPPARAGRVRPIRPCEFLTSPEVVRAFAPALQSLSLVHELLTPKQFTQRCLDLGFTSVPPVSQSPQHPIASKSMPKKRDFTQSKAGPSEASFVNLEEASAGVFTDTETVQSFQVVDLESEARSGVVHGKYLITSIASVCG